ncbi:MAG: TadE/TadG family type IV pilus assembly protein [Myxococcales bacterium]
MARVSSDDERGAVYVEFLIAFFPIFLLFLALCQLALVGAAEAVVRHAAYAAVRSAIVVLHDDPKKFDGAERGSLVEGKAARMSNLDAITSKLGIRRVSKRRSKRSAIVDSIVSQQGARMVPIQTAAFLPLLALAPNEGSVLESSDSVSRALVAASDQQLGFAAEYTRAAAIVTLHDSEDSQELSMDPVQSHAPVTTRVTYLFHCTIPVVRTIMCRTLESIATDGSLGMALAYKTKGWIRADARFKLLTATATLPNQGASYLSESAE